MKTQLNQDLVLKLTLEKKPVREVRGKLEFEPNPSLKPYIVTDSHQKAPVGFAVKVGATKKTYLIQRRHGAKVLQVKVGNVSDFLTIDAARDKAREKAGGITATGKNPNVTAREKSAAEKTLGDCFTEYRDELGKPPEPAKENTFIAFDKARNKLEAWENIKVKEITPKMVLDRFDEIYAKTPTTAEQTFRWAHVAIKVAIEMEEDAAESAGREPLLTYNPFKILHKKKRFRSRKQLEEAYQAKGVRKPLSVRDTMGPFFNAVWGRRKENRMGCDYIICCMLWGTRKSEGASLQWREMLTDQEAKENSWVCLKTRKVFFCDTKNRTSHMLPITDAVLEVLKGRHDRIEEARPSQQKWVFPARSPFSKTGHYTDGRSLLGYICQDAGIPQIAPHDARRSFGQIAEEMTTYGMVKRLLSLQKCGRPCSSRRWGVCQMRVPRRIHGGPHEPDILDGSTRQFGRRMAG